MYSRCLFCHGDLGSNDVIETMPVGRRLAVDARLGRLWVVCGHCARWNLTALEERWEAVEQCEREFRDASLRCSVESIGLARLADGTEVVRIGLALEPEIAAWRYGPRLRRLAGDRLRGSLDRGIAAVQGIAGALMRTVPGPRPGYDPRTWLRIRWHRQRVVTAVGQDGRTLPVRALHLEHAELLRPERGRHWSLRVAHDEGVSLLTGAVALRTAARLLTAINGAGATSLQVEAALRKLEDAARKEAYFTRIGALALRTSWGLVPDAPADLPVEPDALSVAERLALRLTNRSFWGRGGTGSELLTRLPQLPLVDRLALEMAVHEDAERRALQGELRQLEAMWREAEEIAAIADGLPDGPAFPGPVQSCRFPDPAPPDAASRR